MDAQPSSESDLNSNPLAIPADSGAEDQQGSGRVMVMITLEQRAALLEYLAQQPYKDVAGGIEFLRQALTINVKFAPESDSGEAGGP